MEDAHTSSVEEILTFFNTDEEAGLSDEQVQQAQEKYGPNGKPPLIHGTHDKITTVIIYLKKKIPCILLVSRNVTW